MKNIKNLFCDFPLAKMLDELGFKEKCLGSYLGFGNGEMREDNPKIYKTTEPELFISGQFPSSEDKAEELQLNCFGFCHAPTWWQIKEWLWEKHKIEIEITHTIDDEQFDYDAYSHIEGYSEWILGKQEHNSPITAEIDGIKKAVEYLYKEHHKTKVL